jgi:hypothetical protein
MIRLLQPKKWWVVYLYVLLVPYVVLAAGTERSMMESQKTVAHLQDHLEVKNEGRSSHFHILIAKLWENV